MKSFVFFSVFFTLKLSIGFCQIPQTLSYQGLLTDNSGVPLTDGSYAVTFRFYAAATGGTAITSRGPLAVNTFKGLFMTTLGDGTTDNAPLPFSLGDQEFYVGITVSPSTTELSPRVKVTAIPYAFVANTVKNVDASFINTGTLSIARIADNSITNIKLAAGIDANKLVGEVAVANGGTGASTVTAARSNLGLAIGTDVQAYDADLTDLADGTLSGSKVDGTTLTTVSASNVTTGTLSIANGGTGASTSAAARTNLGLIIGTDVQAFDVDLADLSDGTLTGSKVDGTTLTTLSATNITSGTLAIGNGGTGSTTAANARTNLGLAIGTNVQAFDADLTDLSDGILSGVSIALTGTDASKLAGGTTAQRPSSPVEGQIRYNSTEKVMEYYNGTNWYFLMPKVAYLRDEKTSGTNGGAYTCCGWQTRDLNTLDAGSDDFVSLNAPRFTLPAGEYIIEVAAPASEMSGHRIKLYETDGSGADIAFGTSENAATGQGYVITKSVLVKRLTITTSKTYEIRHRGQTSNGVDLALGVNVSMGPEIYTQVKVTKLR